jgi:hypothetical protein
LRSHAARTCSSLRHLHKIKAFRRKRKESPAPCRGSLTVAASTRCRRWSPITPPPAPSTSSEPSRHPHQLAFHQPHRPAPRDRVGGDSPLPVGLAVLDYFEVGQFFQGMSSVTSRSWSPSAPSLPSSGTSESQTAPGMPWIPQKRHRPSRKPPLTTSSAWAVQ